MFQSNLLLLGCVICLTFSLIVHNFYSHCVNLQYLALKESNKFWVIRKYAFHLIVRFTAVVCMFWKMISILVFFFFFLLKHFMLTFYVSSSAHTSFFHHVIMYFIVKVSGNSALFPAPSHCMVCNFLFDFIYPKILSRTVRFIF